MPGFRWQLLFDYTSGGPDPESLVRKAGWSESVYSPSYSADFVTKIADFATKRAKLLPKGINILGYRVQQVDPSASANQVPLFRSGSAGSNTNAVDIPQMALLLRVRGTGVTNVRSMRLVGLPDARVQAGEYNPGWGWQDDVRNYLTSLQNWSFRGVDLTQAKVRIDNVAADGTYTLVSDLGLAVNDTVKVFNTVDALENKVSGIFKVNSVTSLRVGKLAGWTAGVCTKGEVRKQVPIYPQIIAPIESVSRVTTRKVGRPLNGYRGRRSKRRR